MAETGTISEQVKPTIGERIRRYMDRARQIREDRLDRLRHPVSSEAAQELKKVYGALPEGQLQEALKQLDQPLRESLRPLDRRVRRDDFVMAVIKLALLAPTHGAVLLLRQPSRMYRGHIREFGAAFAELVQKPGVQEAFSQPNTDPDERVNMIIRVMLHGKDMDSLSPTEQNPEKPATTPVLQ